MEVWSATPTGPAWSVGALFVGFYSRFYPRLWGFGPEVRKALWGEHFWSLSYCVVSTGGAPLDIVKAYVENQRSEPKGPGRPKMR